MVHGKGNLEAQGKGQGKAQSKYAEPAGPAEPDGHGGHAGPARHFYVFLFQHTTRMCDRLKVNV